MDALSNCVKVTFVNNKSDLSLENKKCILLVSVGQKYHEGDSLAGTIDLINKSGFASCVIAVADTLQRHNFLKMTPEEAYQCSLHTGDEWLTRNAEIINKLKCKVEILRWDAVLQDVDYPAFRAKVETEYAENNIYRDAVNSTIFTFTDRVKKRDENFDFDTVFNNCLKYLIEECPIIMPLWAAQDYDFIIYPKKMTNAMAMTREIFVKDHYPDKANWLSLKFKKLSKAANDESAYFSREAAL